MGAASPERGLSALTIDQFFPVWDRLTPEQRELLTSRAVSRDVPRGALLHGGSADCVGLFLVRAGQLRAFILSDEGREVTLYRLFPGDICLFSGSCMFSQLRFDIHVEAEEGSLLWVIPPTVYQQLMEASAPLANFTSQLLSARFADVMWLLDQILFRRIDSRLAAFLLEESAIQKTDRLSITHERIARHLGSAREVVTRMLKYFQQEGMVSLSRGTVALTDRDALARLAA